MENLLIQILIIELEIEQFLLLAITARGWSLRGGARRTTVVRLHRLCHFPRRGSRNPREESRQYRRDQGNYGVTSTIGFGMMFGLHIAFAGGVAASASVGKKYPEMEPNGWAYHPGKVITEAYGTQPDILAVGTDLTAENALDVLADRQLSASSIISPTSGPLHRTACGRRVRRQRAGSSSETR